MGKKLSQASMKISKDVHNKKQLSSLINILKPKVYITDPSNFKKLVQDLTGNGTVEINSCEAQVTFSEPAPPPRIPQPFGQQWAPIIEILDQGDDHDYNNNNHHHGYEDTTSLDLSVDNISDSSMPFGNSPELYIPDNEALNMLENMEFPSSFAEVEPWQFEIDPFSNYYGYDATNCIPKFQHEVCVSDYDLSSIAHLI